MKRELADGISIRYAEEGEGAALVTLARMAGHAADMSMIEALVVAGRAFVAVRDASGERLGLAAVGDLDGALTVETLGVLPEERRQGIGSALVTTVEEYGRWAYYATLLAVPQDPEATEFMFRRGFLSVDMARMPEAISRLGHGRTVVTKRL